MSSKIVLKDAYKTYTLDQDKVISPAETVARFREILDRTGLDILAETVRIDNGRLDIPVYLSYCGKEAFHTIGTRKQMGKGATPVQAEASAVMELAERFSFFAFQKNPQNFIKACYHDLDSNLIDFEHIALSVHDCSDDLPAAEAFFKTIPFNWTGAYNLTGEREILIPFDWFYLINEFNGPSAGNCYEEAILQGIGEIVERHVSSLVSQKKISLPRIRPESAADPLVKEMIDKFRRNGIMFYLSDFSLDMGIPTVGLLAYDPATFPQKSEIVWTAGTTPSPEKALSRAFTETAQLAGDFNSGSNYVASGLPKPSSIEQMAYITQSAKEVNINELPDLSHPNIKTEILNYVYALSQKQMDVILINTSHPQLMIPAFYTIIPGAHFRERARSAGVGIFSAKYVAENMEYTQAMHRLTEFDRLLPGKYYTKFYLGFVQLSAGQQEAALPYFHQSLQLNPPPQEMIDILTYTGICYKDMEKYSQALEVLETGEKLDANRTEIYNLKGFCHYKLKEYEKAIADFKQVLRLNPSSAIDYANIGSNYREIGDMAQAAAYYETALSIDPNIEFARNALNKIKG